MTEDDTTAVSPALPGNQWLVFGPDWGRHPSVSQHLFSQFLGKDPVLWVETVGLRVPRLSWQDVRRSFQKLMDFCSGRRRLQAHAVSGLNILSPATLPFTKFHLVRRFNLWQVQRSVSKAVRRLGFDHHTLVVTVPSQCDFVGQLQESASLYYCIDDYALWPGMNSDHVRSMETELIRRVDAVVVASHGLYDRLKSFGKPVHILSHGVDTQHFQDASRRAATSRSVFEIVYFGLIDERLDEALLCEIATAMPSARLRLIGPLTVPLPRLTSLANVIFEGPVDYRDLPSVVADAGLFILPFNLNALALSCSPIKIKEYLACGRPVVATALPEVRHLSDVVHVAEDRAAFLQLVQAAAEKRLAFDADKVAAYVSAESWRSKAHQFAALVAETMGRKVIRR